MSDHDHRAAKPSAWVTCSMVTNCGRICIGRRKINLSQVFAGQHIGIKEVEEKIWLVSFMHYDLLGSSAGPLT